jgi:YD repeat-containing protein
VNPDLSFRTAAYSLESVEEVDEEGNRTDPGATHSGVKTRRILDANGRVQKIEQYLSGRTITTTYTYDIKGHLLRHVDALGNAVTFDYDLLGRKLRTYARRRRR